MIDSVALLQLENATCLGIETEIVRELPVREADREPRQADVEAVSKDRPVLSTSIGTYLVLRVAEAVVAKAQPLEAPHASEIGVAAETEIEIEIRIETLEGLGMRRNFVVGAGLEAGAVGEIGTGIGRRLGAGVVVLT